MNIAPLHAVRIAGLSALALGLVTLSAGSASAHVTATPSTTAAGAYSVVTFSVGHGCDGSPTTKIAIEMPESLVTVTPTINPGWSVTKDMQTLDEPVDDGHGGQYTERVKQVVYTADTPLPDGFRTTFELSLQLHGEEGDQLVFPAIQTCEEGETAWIQTVEEGAEEPDHPAPFVTLTASEGDGHGHGGDSDETEGDHSGEASGDDSDALGWTGLAVGALGLAAGGTALARSRKSA